MVHTHRLANLKEIKDVNVTEEEIIELRATFISYFGQALMAKNDQKTIFNQIVKWAKESGEFASNLGISLSGALENTTYYRKFIWEVLKEEIRNHNIPTDTIFELITIIDPLLDKAVYVFSLTLCKYSSRNTTKSKECFP
ncbi:hypothetical protein HNP21_006066 [Bacillus aryabhattai]|uniref:Uncharacterized protein n=1 Tax=Priestia aryabhattai TaxID=412384 RepID=A0A7W3RIU5_PRIAR|nr:hypothetical protein [Priestia aryabhattai]MBA9042888.1 hypothetical protein [Priestia aryabhattai]